MLDTARLVRYYDRMTLRDGSEPPMRAQSERDDAPWANADERNLLAELNAAIDDDGEDGRLSTGSRPAR